MAEVTKRAGLGQDGYFQYQPETTYGTAATGSEIDLPIKDGTEFTAYPEPIENQNIINDRTKQDVQKGRIMVDGTLVVDGWPTLIGGLLNQFFGAANGTTDVLDGAYTHNWLVPKTGFLVGKSFTGTQAEGVWEADQLTGCVINSMTFTQDNQGNLEISMEYTGQNFTENITRETTFTFPASATNPPFMFGHASIVATKPDSDTVKFCADTLSITYNWNHNTDRFKVCSSASGGKKDQPTFESIPSIEVTMTVDADQYAVEEARDHGKWDLVIDWTHSVSQAGSTPTYHQLTHELPGCLLAPDTKPNSGNDYLMMDLTFDCSFGGTTTNSGGATVQGEVRLTDATASYT